MIGDWMRKSRRVFALRCKRCKGWGRVMADDGSGRRKPMPCPLCLLVRHGLAERSLDGGVSGNDGAGRA